MKSTFLASLAFLILVLGLAGCATTKPQEEPQHPWMMAKDTTLFINPFTLEQAGFPLYGKKMAPLAEDLRLPSEKEAQALIQKAFEQAGYKPKLRQGLDLGRLHLEADGYDPKAHVGWLYLTDEDFELPNDKALQGKAVLGFFQTKRSAKRISMMELIMLQQICANGQISLALIHARQFAYPAIKTEPAPVVSSAEAVPATDPTKGEEHQTELPTTEPGQAKKTMTIPGTIQTEEDSLKELSARVDFFLNWFKESQRRRNPAKTR